MRILTLKEPFATLICKKIKTIETRSWRTNYRGEIYIHASIKNQNMDIKVKILLRLRIIIHICQDMFYVNVIWLIALR